MPKALDVAISNVAHTLNQYWPEVQEALRKARLGDIADELDASLQEWAEASDDTLKAISESREP